MAAKAITSKAQTHGGRHILRRILCVLLGIAVCIAAAIGLYAYDNMSYQGRLMDMVWDAGFVEKQVELPDGTVLNYGEGGSPEGMPLFLIHGQQVAWEDYARVLPELANKYHIYAVDCHGHGQSSHDPARYNCADMTADFVWFIQNVIGSPCVLSGHSSGGVLATNIAATAPELALGLLIEDAPFYCFTPENMIERNAFVWSDGFELMHDFMNQTADDNFYSYYFRNGFIWSKFGPLADVIADEARNFSQAHPDEPMRVWFMPYSFTNGQYYTYQYDLEFGEAFYDGAWFAGLDEDAMLSAVKCPTVYLKAQTTYYEDTLICANTEADAERVTSLISGCERITTPTNDHDIHFVYPEKFIDALEQLRSRIA